jgi:hypothetical protein
VNIDLDLKKIITVVFLVSLLSVLQSAANPNSCLLPLSTFSEVENIFIRDSTKYIKITGIVKLKMDGLPIEGVKIKVKTKVKGKRLITYSDRDGRFTILIPDTSYHIIISLKGFKKKEVSFMGNDYHDIWLEDSSPIRDPVVVDPTDKDR